MEQRKITAIVEKPADPASDYAVIGIYLYDGTVFETVGGTAWSSIWS
jgi:dTDP-glucose pyrophosphorylase